MPNLTYQYVVDTAGTQFAQDLIARGLAAGDGAPTYQDISDRVLEATIQRGRQNELDAFGAGRMTLLLRNNDGRFTPENSSSPLYGLLEPGAMVKARVAVPDYTGLISWWDLEEASASTRYDSHGTNHLAPATSGTVAQVNGIVGKAASFVGSDYLSVASNATLLAGDIDITLCAWVYLTAKQDGFIAGKWNTSGPVLEYFLGYDQTNDKFVFDVSATGSVGVAVYASTFGSPALNTWYFVMGFHDAVNNVIGISVNNGAIDTAVHSAGIYTSTNPFTIGCNAAGFYRLSGYVDSVSFWKCVLPTVRNGVGALLYDKFSDANGTWLTAHTVSPTNTPAASWRADVGVDSNITVQNNRATANALSVGANIRTLDVGVSNIRLSATLRSAGVSPGEANELVARFSDNNNYWIVALYNTEFTIFEVNGGVLTSRATTAKTWQTNVDYAFVFTLNGTSIGATVEGGNALSYTSSFNQSATRVGMRIVPDLNNSQTIDDFVVDAL